MEEEILKKDLVAEKKIYKLKIFLEKEKEYFRLKIPVEKIIDIKIINMKNNESRIFNSKSRNMVFKFASKTKDMDIEINSNLDFHESEIQVKPISKYSYYYKRLNSQKRKIVNLLRSNPQLIKRFFCHLKRGGIKSAILKSKEVIGKESINNVFEFKNLNNANKKNSILFVMHSANEGGASLLSLNIIKTLKKNHGLDVITILIQGGKLEKEVKKYSTVYCLNQSSFSYIEDSEKVVKLIQKIKKLGVNKCISNSVTSSIISDVLFKNDIEIISLVHELNTSIEAYDYKKAARNAVKFSKRLIFPNEFVANEFRENYPISDEKIKIKPQGMYNTFKLNITKEKAKEKICEKLKIPLDSKLIMNCAYGDIRKGVDIFFEIYKSFILKNENAHFIWIGNLDPVYEQWLNYDIKKLNLEKNIHFVGYIDELETYYKGVDIFLLTSREDPFPSAVLESISLGTPALAFENTGGIPELNNKIGSLNIEYLNIENSVEKIEILLKNKELYSEVSQKGEEYIKKEHDHEKYVQFLIKELEIPHVFKVSVIIPNYNYEIFLEERLYTICNQSYKPYEIIFLDDCSSDNSIKKAETLLKEYDIPYRIIPNKENKGCFKQWAAGIELAKGDIVWIAEADDLCELSFIESLISSFKDSEVNLAYSQSKIINEKSEIIMENYLEYTNDLSEIKWLDNYYASGQEEIVDGLAIKNTIPNASAVLIRKSAIIHDIEELKKYSICGDWFAYISSIKNGKIFFNAKNLNMHRRHSKSIVSKSEKQLLFYEELIEVKKDILKNFKVPKDQKASFIGGIVREYERLGCIGSNVGNIYEDKILGFKMKELEKIFNQQITDNIFLKGRKKILFVMPDFEIGGGQMLVIRLANYLAPFQDVYVYSARPWLYNENVVNMFSSMVNVIDSHGDPKELREFIEKNDINIINSHIWWSDKVVYKAIKDMENITWIISMHGCYEALLENENWDVEFKIIVEEMFEKSNYIIYATEKNRKIFNYLNYTKNDKIEKIYYGYEIQNMTAINKEILQIDKKTKVFGMVARGIKEKGWNEAIEATILLNEELEEKIHLVLIGEGDEIERLNLKNKKIEYIHFINANSKPFEWIQWIKMFDVCLLPTYFISESLPNSVIEYLAYDKPIITTNIGDIKNMIYDESGKKAGILLELKNNKVDILELKNAMKEMLNEDIYKKYKENSHDLFDKKFNMERFVSDYFSLFLERKNL